MRSQIRKATSLLALVGLALIVCAGAARAVTVTVFRNFGPNQSYDFQSGQWMVTGSNFGIVSQAMSFTASSTADLQSAILPLLDCCPSLNQPMSLYLESNTSSNLPGNVLAALTQVGRIPVYPTSPTSGLVTFDYTMGAPVELTAGTQYWLVAFQTGAFTEDLWPFSLNDNGAVAQSIGSDTGPWTTVSGPPKAAFQVEGTVPLTPTPEPSSLLLLATALAGGLGWWMMAERKRRAT